MPSVLVQGHYYAELAVSSLAVAKTTASRLLIDTGLGATTLMKTDALPLNQAATENNRIMNTLCYCYRLAMFAIAQDVTHSDELKQVPAAYGSSPEIRLDVRAISDDEDFLSLRSVAPLAPEMCETENTG